MNERRSERRFPARYAFCASHAEAVTQAGYTVDLSGKGLRFIVPLAYELNDLVEIDLHVRTDKAICFVARIEHGGANSDGPGFLYGATIAQIAPGDQESLASVLDGLARQ